MLFQWIHLLKYFVNTSMLNHVLYIIIFKVVYVTFFLVSTLFYNIYIYYIYIYVYIYISKYNIHMHTYIHFYLYIIYTYYVYTKKSLMTAT